MAGKRPAAHSTHRSEDVGGAHRVGTGAPLDLVACPTRGAARVARATERALRRRSATPLLAARVKQRTDRAAHELARCPIAARINDCAVLRATIALLTRFPHPVPAHRGCTAPHVGRHVLTARRHV